MKLPRDLSGRDRIKALGRPGYYDVRQEEKPCAAHCHAGRKDQRTIPMHDPLKPGTLNAILRHVAGHATLTRDELLKLLFS